MIAVVKGIRQEFVCLFLFGFYRIVDYSFFFPSLPYLQGAPPFSTDLYLLSEPTFSLLFPFNLLLWSWYCEWPDVGTWCWTLFFHEWFCLCFICVLWFPLLFFIDSLKLLLSCSTHRLPEAVRAPLIGNWSLWHSVSSILEVVCGFICTLCDFIFWGERDWDSGCYHYPPDSQVLENLFKIKILKS